MTDAQPTPSNARSGLGAALLAGFALLAPLVTARAETAPAPVPATTAPDAAPPDQRQQLQDLQQGIEISAAKRKELAAEIAELETDRAKFEAALIDTTRKVYDEEGRISDAERRIQDLAKREDDTKRSLQGRRAIVTDVLAALQRMGRKPPPALLVEPDDVLKAIRTSMLLGTLLPGMRAQTEALVADLTELSRTRKAIEAERHAMNDDLASLGAERQRLGALVEARQAALGQAESAMASERDKAMRMAQQAGSLKDLISHMETQGGIAGQAANAARQSDEKLAAMMPNGLGQPGAAPPKDPARLAPSVAFASTKGQLERPVSGSVLRHFGETDGLGGTEKGDLVGTRQNAIVAAPADGWVAYAGPYRSFGKLLILNAGGGYYIVLAGMDRINVDLGQFVLAGEPIAVMGDGSTKTAAAVALGATQPVLYVEFRKDGATIDPGPWWARPELQRVRG
jgi:septal ring factor EnvC (AmiA/AmiB activator)